MNTEKNSTLTSPETGSSNIVSAIMVPHPPLILPKIGKGEEKKIAEIDEAYQKAAKLIADSNPDTVVIISPHAPAWLDYIQISSGKKAYGDMRAFGDFEDAFEIEYDEELAREISKLAEENGIPAGTKGRQERELDHGTMVPLYYLKPLLPDAKYIRIGIGGVDNLDHYETGMMIKKAAEKLGRKVAVVASGDLSHCQKAGTNYGFKACGPAYDEKIMEIMSNAEFERLLEMSDQEADEAMVCGQKPFCVLAGTMDGSKPESEGLAHSAYFGVGYGVCTYDNLKPDDSRHFLQKEKEKEQQEYQKRIKNEDPWVALARNTIENAVAGSALNNKKIEIPAEMVDEKAGVFVSIHKNGELRGCIGTTEPTAENVAMEISNNAISAAFHDPRFPAIRPSELPTLDINVDVLKAPEKINSADQLDVKKYGVIVTKGSRRGLLLPDLEGIDTVEKQIAIAKQKAGIRPDESVELERFEVIRHK